MTGQRPHAGIVLTPQENAVAIGVKVLSFDVEIDKVWMKSTSVFSDFIGFGAIAGLRYFPDISVLI